MALTIRKKDDLIDMTEIKRNCVSEIKNDKFSFMWTLKNFTASTGKTTINSPIFKGGETHQHEWNVECVQNNGTSAILQNSTLSLYLRLQKSGNGAFPNKAVKACCSMSIVDLNGRILKTKTAGFHEYIIPVASGFGFASYVSIQEILNPANNYLVNDGKDLQLLFDVIVETESQVFHHFVDSEPIDGSIDMEMKSLRVLSEQMKNFVPQSGQEDLDGFDVHIISGEGTKFPALSHILSARSPVVKAMLNSSMTESVSKTITIRGFPDEIIRGFLEYIYTARTEVIKSNPMDLMRLADQYEVLELVRSCENQLLTDLKIENATEMFLLAYLHSLDWLKSKVTCFIKRNEKAVKETESFGKARRENPAAVLELYTLLHS